MRIQKIALVAVLAAAGAAHAEEGVGLRIGTLGYGGDFGWHVAPALNARLGYSWYSHNTTV